MEKVNKKAENIYWYLCGLPLYKEQDLCYNITCWDDEVWLSLVEHYVRDVGAAGSNPVTSTFIRMAVYSDKRCVQPFLRLYGSAQNVKIALQTAPVQLKPQEKLHGKLHEIPVWPEKQQNGMRSRSLQRGVFDRKVIEFVK